MQAVSSAEIPSMVATLCSYESLLGPYHPQTLTLMTEVVVACWHQGELSIARHLLERAIRDLGRNLGRDHDLRLRALAAMRDLLLRQSDYGQAGAYQRGVLECRFQRFGEEHPETLTSRQHLASIVLQTLERETQTENRRLH